MATQKINQEFYVRELVNYWHDKNHSPEYRRECLKFWKDIMAKSGELKSVYAEVVKRLEVAQ